MKINTFAGLLQESKRMRDVVLSSGIEMPSNAQIEIILDEEDYREFLKDYSTDMFSMINYSSIKTYELNDIKIRAHDIVFHIKREEKPDKLFNEIETMKWLGDNFPKLHISTVFDLNLVEVLNSYYKFRKNERKTI